MIRYADVPLEADASGGDARDGVSGTAAASLPVRYVLNQTWPTAQVLATSAHPSRLERAASVLFDLAFEAGERVALEIIPTLDLDASG